MIFLELVAMMLCCFVSGFFWSIITSPTDTLSDMLSLARIFELFLLGSSSLMVAYIKSDIKKRSNVANFISNIIIIIYVIKLFLLWLRMW